MWRLPDSGEQIRPRIEYLLATEKRKLLNKGPWEISERKLDHPMVFQHHPPEYGVKYICEVTAKEMTAALRGVTE